MPKYVYLFTEGNKDMRELLGGKGANLAEMTAIGLPVPKGFTITTEACNKYYEDNMRIDQVVEEEIFAKLKELEEVTNKEFGNPNKPLLLSVRSGARASMPGMMDSIHFIGLNDEVASVYADTTDNPRFVYDTYRRFIQTYADIACNFSDIKFESFFEELKEELNVLNDTDLTVDNLKYIIERYKEEYQKRAGENFPCDPKVQLLNAITGVFKSWNGDRAKSYRRLNNIPDSWGTAVNVQENVFGNLNDLSGTGVAFSRNPATGEKEIFGEYLINAQGDDVVAGIRTPEPLSKLKEVMPDIYNEFVNIVDKLEKHFKDMQDMEFTIENGKLYMLQTRNAKRTAKAHLKVATDLVKEGLITKEEAIMRIDPEILNDLLHPTFNSESLAKGKLIATGLAASPGSGVGKIYFSPEDIKNAKNRDEKTILIRRETSPEDIEGINDANGILTVRGGMTSHAAVVARGMGKCCITGCSDIIIDYDNKTLTTKDGLIYHEGDELSLDGTTGNVYEGIIETEEATISGVFKTFMSWVDDARRLKVRANADTPDAARIAHQLGSEGIGLCRTEHMFFESKRLFSFRKMIMAPNKDKRIEALNEILPYQRSDFEGLFRVSAPYSVTIRYLDPPLHEFLPRKEEEIALLAESLKISVKNLNIKINSLKEFNPMMGHRGCRLAITYPEVIEMQTRAIVEAAINVKKEGLEVRPELMIPLIGDESELIYLKDIVHKTANNIIESSGVKLEYEVGTMIEIPRATLIADKIAQHAEFFSFGTNDLTQMTYGFSRDDAGKFLEDYYNKKIFNFDPFATIDEIGVGSLVKLAIKKGRSVRPNIHLGICGEHGGNPKSIEFCDKIGLDYVSCSPYRVPIARLAAAQASIKSNQTK